MAANKLAMMDHIEDPKRVIQDKVEKYIHPAKVAGWKFLVGIYIRPDKTKGGIYLTDRIRDEDIYQGKVGLVLKLGPTAFVDDDRRNFHPDSVPEVGDWVLYGANEGRACEIGGHPCRFIDDTSLLAIIPHPNGYL